MNSNPELLLIAAAAAAGVFDGMLFSACPIQ